MIDEKKLIEDIRKWDESMVDEPSIVHSVLDSVIQVIEDQPIFGEWIPVSERLPDEHDSMFAKFKGTQNWTNGMFEKISDSVNVTIEFENGKRVTTMDHTTDGKWRCEKKFGLNTKVIAWQPLPEPYKKGAEI